MYNSSIADQLLAQSTPFFVIVIVMTNDDKRSILSFLSSLFLVLSSPFSRLSNTFFIHCGKLSLFLAICHREKRDVNDKKSPNRQKYNDGTPKTYDGPKNGDDKISILCNQN